MKSRKMQLYDSLKAIFLHIDNHEKNFLAQYGLNVARFFTLMHLSKHPGINYIDLSDRMLCTKSNTTRVVQGMQKDGLVVRQNHPADGRSYQLFLTPAGETLFHRAYPGYQHMVESLMSQFSDEDIARYTGDSRMIESTLAKGLAKSGNGAKAPASAKTAPRAGIAPNVDGKLASQGQTFQRRNK